jgi:hypothetical protein
VGGVVCFSSHSVGHFVLECCMTPPARFTAEQIEAEIQLHLRDETRAMLRQGAADANFIKALRVKLMKLPDVWPSGQNSLQGYVVDLFDRLRAERGGEEG